MDIKFINRAVSIDPGIHATGIAVWLNSNLIRTDLVDSKKTGIHAWLEISDKAWRFSGSTDQLIIEMPQIYDRRSRSKGDPNDLIQLAGFVGFLICNNVNNPDNCQLVRPAEWKGQHSKQITKNRCLATLAEKEIDNITLPRAASLQHNIWDAIGIGLWYLKRRPNSLSVASPAHH